MSIDQKNKLLLSEIISALLLEQGERGFVYEQTLIDALERSGISVSPAAGNNSSISDLGFRACAIDVASEVKLGHNDNLGAIRKHHFLSLSWDGSSFSGIPKEGSPFHDTVVGLIDAMNDSSHIKNKMKDLAPYVTPYKPLPWDLKSAFGHDAPVSTQGERDLYNIVRNEQKPDRQIDFPIPGGKTGAPRGSKQIANLSDGVEIDQSVLMSIMSGKKGPNGAPTSYVIVGKGPGSEGNAAGQLYSLGSDPLNTGAPVYSPASVGVEIRFGGAGSAYDPAKEKGGRSYGFYFKTKATGASNSGLSFESAQELADILTAGIPKDKCVEGTVPNTENMQHLRTLIRESLLFEELTATDKKEIEKIARKQSKKEITKVIGNDLSKTIQKEVEKIFKNKATKDEIATVCQAVMKKLYKALSTSHSNVIDGIKV